MYMMELIKALITSDSRSHLCSRKTMSVKLMMKTFWVLCSIERLQRAYFAVMQGEFCNYQLWGVLDFSVELKQGR